MYHCIYLIIGLCSFRAPWYEYMIFISYFLLILFFWSFEASLVPQMVKNIPAKLETQVQSLGQEDPLERGMATPSSVLACSIPWTKAIVYGVAKSWKATNTFHFEAFFSLEYCFTCISWVVICSVSLSILLYILWFHSGFSIPCKI